MNDINKAFNDWQKQDIERLKNIRNNKENENNILFKFVLIIVIIFIVCVFFNS